MGRQRGRQIHSVNARQGETHKFSWLLWMTAGGGARDDSRPSADTVHSLRDPRGDRNHMQTCKVTSSVLVICLVLVGFSFLAGCTQTGPGVANVPGTENDSGVVKTDAGYVSGITRTASGSILGIPFAAPPTGDLRWRPPAPVKPWDGVKETKLYSPACPQPAAADPAPLNMSEDCLYLNVWTPAKSADEKLPVMVFFYGGAFGKIAGSMPLYNGTALAEKGVIVVTTNYRVGALGFLAHPQLDNESPHNVSGNYGLLDQMAALQWVQRNIGAVRRRPVPGDHLRAVGRRGECPHPPCQPAEQRPLSSRQLSRAARSGRTGRKSMPSIPKPMPNSSGKRTHKASGTPARMRLRRCEN